MRRRPAATATLDWKDPDVPKRERRESPQRAPWARREGGGEAYAGEECGCKERGGEE